MLNEVMIPSSRVARVSDMRTLPDLDEDSILLVVKNGKCWKLPVKAIKNLILDKIENNVFSSIGNIKDKLASTTKEYKQGLAALKPLVENCNKSLAEILKNTIIKYKSLSTDFSSNLSSVNDKLSASILCTASKINNIQNEIVQHAISAEALINENSKISQDIINIANNVDALQNTVYQQNNLVKADIDKIQDVCNQTYAEINDKYALLELSSKLLDNTIAKTNTTIDEIIKKQNDFDLIQQSEINNIKNISNDLYSFQSRINQNIDKIKEEFLSSVEDIHNELYQHNVNVSNISISLSNSLSTSTAAMQLITTTLLNKLNFAEKNIDEFEKQLADTKQTISQQMSSDFNVLSTLIATISADIGKQNNASTVELEAKLYGVSILQIDEAGNKTVEQINIGDITKIMNILEELSAKVEELLSKNNK